MYRIFNFNICIMKKVICFWILLTSISNTNAQGNLVRGLVTDLERGENLSFARVYIVGTTQGTNSDDSGQFELYCNQKEGKIVVTYLGYHPDTMYWKTGNYLHFQLKPTHTALREVVVTGTLKETSKMESPIPVEVYTPKFFLRNPTPSLLEAMQNINGVRPQLNCSVCNTGDIHINGMEGPYTMILIDGMPIVSGLATVYGLSGIPNSMIQRVEVVKGPAATVYGSEAVGGLINVITKSPLNAPKLSMDLSSTTYLENNLDLGYSKNWGKTSMLLSANYFYLDKRWDKNNDHFTDITLQNRLSVFNKWRFERKHNRQANVAFRYVWEDRFGGDLRWEKPFRGGDIR